MIVEVKLHRHSNFFEGPIFIPLFDVYAIYIHIKIRLWKKKKYRIRWHTYLSYLFSFFFALNYIFLSLYLQLWFPFFLLYIFTYSKTWPGFGLTYTKELQPRSRRLLSHIFAKLSTFPVCAKSLRIRASMDIHRKWRV